jgi:hypothetical protein
MCSVFKIALAAWANPENMFFFRSREVSAFAHIKMIMHQFDVECVLCWTECFHEAFKRPKIDHVPCDIVPPMLGLEIHAKWITINMEAETTFNLAG